MRQSQRSVFFDGQQIYYTLTRKDVKNLNLRIKPDGSVHVSAGARVPLSFIDAFVLKKAAFILSAQQTFAARAAPHVLRCAEGEAFILLGLPCRFAVQRGDRDGVRVKDGVIFLTVKKPEEVRDRVRVFEGWLDQTCRQVFGDVLAEVYPRFSALGVKEASLRVRDMKTRWGTCQTKTGVITLNRRLIHTPRDCIVYVAAHEYCHFLHPDHSARFYAQLCAVLPDWKARKQRLNACAGVWM